jgi:hypothetical protein
MDFWFKAGQKAKKGQNLDIFSKVETSNAETEACSAISNSAATS